MPDIQPTYRYPDSDNSEVMFLTARREDAKDILDEQSCYATQLIDYIQSQPGQSAVNLISCLRNLVDKQAELNSNNADMV